MEDAPRLLLPWWLCGIVVCAMSVIVGMQIVYADKINARATTRTVTCEGAYKAAEERGVVLALECGVGGKLVMGDARVILSFIENPGTLTCRVASLANGKPTLIGCDPRT